MATTTPQTQPTKTTQPPPSEDYRAKNLINAREAKKNKNRSVNFATPESTEKKIPPESSSSSEDSDDDMKDVDLTELKKFVKKRKRTQEEGEDAAKRFKVFIPGNNDDDNGSSLFGEASGDLLKAGLRILLYSVAVAGSLYLSGLRKGSSHPSFPSGEEMVNIYK